MHPGTFACRCDRCDGGFHMITTIATIELKSVSAIVVSTIAVITAIVAIIRKPGLTYQYLEMLFVSRTCKLK